MRNPSSLFVLASLLAVTSPRCIDEQPPEEPKYFYYGEEALSLRILVSERLTHRLTSTILKVFVEEVLGYYNVSFVDIEDVISAFDPDTQFSYLSSCTDFSCQNLDHLPFNSLAPVPRAMVDMEMWLPPNFQVNDWKVEDVGRLGPGGRFGWFIPAGFASSIPPIKDHWRAFTNHNVSRLFAPSRDAMDYITPRLKNSKGEFFCQDDKLCQNGGIYISKRCQRKRHSGGDPKCALMLTDFPVESTLFPTSIVLHQIEELGLLVNLAFLGDNLMDALQYLNTSPEVLSGDKSFLVFHYTPSPLTTTFNLTTVKFETCYHRWTHVYNGNASEMLPDCLYNFNRFAKVVWPPLKEGAPILYETLRKMELSQENYDELLALHAERESSTQLAPLDSDLLRDVACTWLNRQATGSRTGFKNYERWSMIGKSKQKLRIGGIFPIRGNKYAAPELLPVAQLALRDVNANSSILSNYDLLIHISDGQCTADVVMKRFIEIITNRDYKSFVGILGPACSDTVEPIAGVSKHFRTVVITYSAEGSISDEAGGDNNYPYFFRTIAENKQYKYVYLEILKKLQWNKVASLTQDGHKYSQYISHLQDLLQTSSINFIMNRKFPRETTDMTLYLEDLKERGARIIIGEFFESAARAIICAAYTKQMTQKQGYVWFLPAWYQHDWYDIDAIREDGVEDEMLPNCTTKQMVEALNGHLSLIHANYAQDNETMQTGESVGDWKVKLKDTLDQHPEFDGSHPNKYSGYVYDAVWLYALALDRLIKQNKSYIQDIHSDRSINEFVKILSDTDFNGVSGRINFLNGPSRRSNIKVMQWYDNDTHEIGVYEPDYSQTGGQGQLINWEGHKLRWHTLDGTKPTDHSKECDILSQFATALDIECEQAITVAFVIGFGTLLGILLLIFIIFKRRYELKMKQTEERMRALGLLTPTSVLTLDEWEIPRDRVVINRKLGEGAFGTVYGGEAFFDEKGWVAVAVKTLKTGSSVEEKLDFLSEAEMMKRFDHKNIVKLLGVCTRNEPVYTVMEFMLYGDLKTYLLARRHLVNERNREELDEVSNRRLTSMALDVARGLSYLAELKYVHRDVACRNCLVNSSRIVKLADFGMTRPMYENDYYRFNRKGMLPVRWMAPESLADGLFTPMSDVWSYGVLLYEMITFGSFPFQGLSNNQVLEHVKAGNTLTIPHGIKTQLETLLKSCWHMTPTKRPTSSEIVELLSNNPRLISPCIDVPLASVQVERTDSLELIPSVRKPSGSVSQTNRPTGMLKGIRANKDYSLGYRDDPPANGQSAYSPMTGGTNGMGSPSNPFRFDAKEPLLSRENSDRMVKNGGVVLQECRGPSGSYVPPGYIMLDHTMGPDTNEYVPSSISSV